MAPGPRSEQSWRATDQIAVLGGPFGFGGDMHKTRTSKIIVLGTLCCAFSTACSGGGGGGGGMSPAASVAMSTPVPATPANMPSPPVATTPDNSDTGIAGSVGAPAPASFGSAPAQLATPGGATF